jgi:hypothetical protein
MLPISTQCEVEVRGMPRAIFDTEPAPLSVDIERVAQVIIDVQRDVSSTRRSVNAAASAFAGAVLTFFGFMQGEAVGIAVTPTVAIAYGIVVVLLYALSRYSARAPAPTGAGEAMAATPAE